MSVSIQCPWSSSGARLAQTPVRVGVELRYLRLLYVSLGNHPRPNVPGITSTYTKQTIHSLTHSLTHSPAPSVTHSNGCNGGHRSGRTLITDTHSPIHSLTRTLSHPLKIWSLQKSSRSDGFTAAGSNKKIGGLGHLTDGTNLLIPQLTDSLGHTGWLIPSPSHSLAHIKTRSLLKLSLDAVGANIPPGGIAIV